jgi:CDP-diacylglycerol--glycerol-3-phosphate 3-phosphatidyltransferase
MVQANLRRKGVAVAVTLAAGTLVAAARPPSQALGSAAVVAYTAGCVYAYGKEVGPGDYVTVLRAVLLAHVAGFVLVRPDGVQRYTAGSAFVLSALLDAVDGAVARRYGGTELGDMLDVEVDGVATLTGSVVGVVHGWLPTVYVGVGLARYAFLAGLKAHSVLFSQDAPGLSRSLTRNLLSVLQTGVIALAILPVVRGEVTRTLGYVAMAPFLLWFFRDWLVACGRYNYPERGD